MKNPVPHNNSFFSSTALATTLDTDDTGIGNSCEIDDGAFVVVVGVPNDQVASNSPVAKNAFADTAIDFRVMSFGVDAAVRNRLCLFDDDGVDDGNAHNGITPLSRWL